MGRLLAAAQQSLEASPKCSHRTSRNQLTPSGAVEPSGPPLAGRAGQEARAWKADASVCDLCKQRASGVQSLGKVASRALLEIGQLASSIGWCSSAAGGGGGAPFDLRCNQTCLPDRSKEPTLEAATNRGPADWPMARLDTKCRFARLHNGQLEFRPAPGRQKSWPICAPDAALAAKLVGPKRHSSHLSAPANEPIIVRASIIAPAIRLRRRSNYSGAPLWSGRWRL